METVFLFPVKFLHGFIEPFLHGWVVIVEVMFLYRFVCTVKMTGEGDAVHGDALPSLEVHFREPFRDGSIADGFDSFERLLPCPVFVRVFSPHPADEIADEEVEP